MAATQQQIDSTTQHFLDIHDITNDLVILKDGTASLLISVDAMNFGLLAEEEQDSIMYAYAGLLNSLNYPIQIVIISHTKDVTGYLRLLKDQEDRAVNRVQQQRILKYREFVSNLIRERNVLDKKFYVAIPAKPLELGVLPVTSVMPGQSKTDVATLDKSIIIEKARSILEPKRDHLIAQFARIGLYSRQLETQEIIQLFYQSYNPEAFEGQSMDDSKSYTAPLVSASVEDVSMNAQNSPLIMTTMDQQVIQPEVTPEPQQTPIDYIPTQMNSLNEMNSVQPQQPATATTVETTPETMQAPLPPTPELPKANPGQIDNTVPQEIEIEINHPAENSTNTSNTTVTSNESTLLEAPTSPINPTTPNLSTVTNTNNLATPAIKPDDTLPPLPEIQ